MSQSQLLSIDEALSRAKKAVKRGNSEIAAQLYQVVLQHQPNHPVAKKALRKLQKELAGSRSRTGAAKVPARDQLVALVNLYRSGQIEEAVLSCRKLLSTYPQSTTVINVLGAALQVQGKFDEALRAFEEAIRLEPNFAEYYCNRGNAQKQLGQWENAFASYDKAIQLKPDYADAHCNLGNGMMELGRVDEAVTSFERAILLKPGLAGAHRNLSILKTYEADDSQIVLMESLLSDPTLGKWDRMELCFALGKAFEDLAEYAKSFAYLKDGNRLRKRELHYDVEDDRRMFEKLAAMFAGTGLNSDLTIADGASVQPVFVVGMMRSGTSLIEQILASHSNVHGAGELVIMSQLVRPILSDRSDVAPQLETDTLNATEIISVREGYLDVLNAMNVSEHVIVDKMPANFRWIGIILSALPEAKVVHVSRDPMATCWSIYKHYFPVAAHEYAYDMEDLAGYYKLYNDWMAFWRERFPDRIYELGYEELTENQEAESRKLLAYCGLEWEERCLDFYKTKRAMRTTSTVQVRRKLYQGSSQAWKNYESHLQTLVDSLGV